MGRAQTRIESGYYDKAVGSVPAHAQCAEDVELVFNNAAVCGNSRRAALVLPAPPACTHLPPPTLPVCCRLSIALISPLGGGKNRLTVALVPSDVQYGRVRGAHVRRQVA